MIMKNFRKIYQNYSDQIYSLIIRIVSSLLSYLLLIVVSRTLNSGQYDTFSVSFTYATIIGYVGTLGFSFGILKFWPSYVASRSYSSAKGVSLYYFFIIVLNYAIACSGLFFFAYEPLFLNVLFLSFVLSVMEYLVAHGRSQGRVVSAFFPRDVAWKFAIIPVWIIGVKLFALKNASELVLLMSITALLVIIYQGLRAIQTAPKQVLRARTTLNWSEWAREGLPMFFAMILQLWFTHADVIVYELVVGKGDVGAYFSAAKTAQFLNLFVVSAGMAAAGRISILYYGKKYKDLQDYLKRTSVFITLPTVAAVLLVVLFSDHILGLFGGEVNMPEVLIVLSLGQLVNAICGPTGYMLQILGQARLYLKILLYSVAISFLSQIVLGHLYGHIGIAVGSSLGLTLWNIISVFYIHRVFSLNPTMFKWSKNDEQR